MVDNRVGDSSGATTAVEENQNTAEQQQPNSAAPAAELEPAEPGAEPAAEESDPVDTAEDGAPIAEPAAEESDPVDSAGDGAASAEPADEPAAEASEPTDAAEDGAAEATEASGAVGAAKDGTKSVEPVADATEADASQEVVASTGQKKDLMKDLFDESSDDEAEPTATEDAAAAKDAAAVDKRKEVIEDLFGSDSSDEEREEEADEAEAPTKKRKLKKKAEKVQSDDEGEGSPKAKKAKSADGDEGGGGDNFIDDEGVPDHLRFDDETGPTHFQGDSDDDQDAGSDRDDGPEIDTGPDELDQVMGVKQKKRKKTSDEVRRQAAERFIDRMHEAADADEQSMAQEEPAIAKLSLLEDLKMNLLKKDLQEFFLDHNCLLALKRYLELLPGTKERPNLTIRTAVLTLVSQLPIGIFHLEKSRGSGETTIAEEIHRMAKDKKESKQNKALSRKLVENWFRLAVGSSTNQRDLARVDMERFQDEPHAPRKPEEPEDSSKVGIQMHSLAVRVPRKASYDYRIRPESSAEAKERASEKISTKKGTTQKDKMKSKMLLKAKASKRQNVRAETCSIEGRNMHKS